MGNLTNKQAKGKKMRQTMNQMLHCRKQTDGNQKGGG